MRKLATLSVVALLWGTATFASGYADVITRAFEAAGYTSVSVSRTQGEWLVRAEANGQVMTFVVDPSNGRSHRISDDSPLHDIGDDHGNDGPQHDLFDDHGQHGAGHDIGDDHGGDRRGGSDDRGGDDHGHHGAGHD